jgi:hypothetical protein
MEKIAAVKKFEEAIGVFYSSRLIIVEQAVSRLLETIASTPELYAVVDECAKSSDYKKEYNKAINRDGVGGIFTLPPNRRQIVTLVTGLLLDFDNKNLSVVDFVTGYFPSGTSHASYLSFCENVIEPYSEAFIYLLEGEPAELTKVMSEELAIIPFPDKAKEDADFWLSSLLDSVLGDNQTPEILRREYAEMIKGLLYVSDLRNPLLIKIVWLGLKNTLASKRPPYRELKEIEMVLKGYGVID